jgi:hypothetical protein
MFQAGFNPTQSIMDKFMNGFIVRVHGFEGVGGLSFPDFGTLEKDIVGWMFVEVKLLLHGIQDLSATVTINRRCGRQDRQECEHLRKRKVEAYFP